MATPIYQTEGIIIGEYESGEADKTFCIFTERFGKIYASAKSVRGHASKLRANLRNLSLVSLDLVNGKSSWKIVGAEGVKQLPVSRENSGYLAFARVAQLARRILGEELDPTLFREVRYIFNLFFAGEHDIKILELISAIRILYGLGYWDSNLEGGIVSGDLSVDGVALARKNYRTLLRAVNDGIDRATS